jgi:acetylornithine deacetylase/succinyl-diaminopimelate desuccinylase-like protein
MTDTLDRLTGETTELLQALIRNQCVNHGTLESGQEDRSARLLRDELEGCGADMQVFEPEPGRSSLIARHAGTDPNAPTLCLMGHTDVVPVSPDGWVNDPFGGELINGEVWGRGAVDMLNLTSSMAVAFRHIVKSGKRYPGDIVYFAVADEEAGGVLGAGHLIDTEWDTLKCDYVLTEYGGTPVQRDDGLVVLMTTAEKGGSGRRIHVTGEPGHGSMPYGTDNAVVTAAAIVSRLVAYDPGLKIDEMFSDRVKALNFPVELERRLLDPGSHQDAIDELEPGMARNLHSCGHMSISPNIVNGGEKINTVPDRVTLQLDIRVLPGDTQDDVDNHIRTAIGDKLASKITIERVTEGNASQSTTDTPLWGALVDSVQMAYPGARVVPSMVTGGTDARFFRKQGVPCYGAGLLSPELGFGEFLNRFHGHNERIDVESLRLTTQLWLDVLDRMWA